MRKQSKKSGIPPNPEEKPAHRFKVVYSDWLVRHSEYATLEEAKTCARSLMEWNTPTDVVDEFGDVRFTTKGK